MNTGVFGPVSGWERVLRGCSTAHSRAKCNCLILSDHPITCALKSLSHEAPLPTTATLLSHKMTVPVLFFFLLVATVASALETISLTSKSSISLTTQRPVEAAPTGAFETTSYHTIAGVANGHVTIPAKTIVISFPTCIQTITPDKNGYLLPGTCNALWDYYPSFITAVAFSVLFSALNTVHIGQAVKYNKVCIDPCPK